MLDLENETFVVKVASLNSNASPSSCPLELNVHSFRRPQISGLIAKEAPTKVPAKYLDFADIFSPDLTSELSKHIEINDCTIELVDDQQPLYGPMTNSIYRKSALTKELKVEDSCKLISTE